MGRILYSFKRIFFQKRVILPNDACTQLLYCQNMKKGLYFHSPINKNSIAVVSFDLLVEHDVSYNCFNHSVAHRFRLVAKNIRMAPSVEVITPRVITTLIGRFSSI